MAAFSQKQINKLIAEAYYDSAYEGQANMMIVTEALEIIRLSLQKNNPFNVWNIITLKINDQTEPYIKRILVKLKVNHQDAIFNHLHQEITEAFKHSSEAGWELWFSYYVDALIYWNGEIYDRLCQQSFPFPEYSLSLLEKLRKLNRLILETRWIDAYPIYQMLAENEKIQNDQKVILEVILGEIELFYFGRDDEALKFFKNAESKMPDSFIARLARGFAEYYQKLGNLKESREYINKAIANDTNNLENFLLMGDTYRDEGKFDIAEQWYRDAININFLKAEPYTKLMSVYGMPSQFPKKGQELSALLLMVDSLDLDNSFNNTLYSAYRDVGSYYSSNKKFTESANCYRKAIELHPEWVSAYVDIGYVLGMQGLYIEGQNEIFRALEIDSEYYEAVEGCAWMAEQRKDTMKAIGLYKRCIQIRPSSAAINYNIIGLLYNDAKDYQSSTEYYQKAIEANPNTALYYSNLAIACQNLHDFHAAENALMQAINIDSKNASYQNLLGNLFYRQGKFNDASRSYMKATNLNATEADYFQNLGLAYEKEGKNEDAEEAFYKH